MDCGWRSERAGEVLYVEGRIRSNALAGASSHQTTAPGPFLTNLALGDKLVRGVITVVSMINLPFEILTAIFEEVDDVRDIWHIRTANRTLCIAATPIAFRVLSVIPTKGSAQNLGRLFDVPDIAAHVREVTFHYTDTDRWRRPLKDDITSALHELASSFYRVHQLPRLKTLSLTFYPDYGLRSGSDSSTLAHQDPVLQTSILGALAASFSVRAPKLTSLSLHNLHTSDLSLLESPSFQTALTTLLRLQLSVLFFNRSPGSYTDLERWCNFWGTLCPRMVLTPTQHSLTELTLHSGTYVGAFFGLSFAGLHFPRLCALSLRMVVFEPSVGATQFILRHAATLARLELLLCKLVYTHSRTAHPMDEESSPEPYYWEYIWDRFAAELTVLVALHVDERRNSWGGAFAECRYVVPVPEGMVYVEKYDFTPSNAAPALRSFQLTVAARSEEARSAF
ncbi:hypothetical protein EDB86DRAFT_2828716 [Lactarius hatsudake]|nr:hypothetical protein EDB86DRAFT_2828716 [Lactarius hatsudake]